MEELFPNTAAQSWRRIHKVAHRTKDIISLKHKEMPRNYIGHFRIEIEKFGPLHTKDFNKARNENFKRDNQLEHLD